MLGNVEQQACRVRTEDEINEAILTVYISIFTGIFGEN